MVKVEYYERCLPDIKQETQRWPKNEIKDHNDLENENKDFFEPVLSTQ